MAGDDCRTLFVVEIAGADKDFSKPVFYPPSWLRCSIPGGFVDWIDTQVPL
jgi:hypothetical protein